MYPELCTGTHRFSSLHHKLKQQRSKYCVDHLIFQKRNLSKTSLRKKEIYEIDLGEWTDRERELDTRKSPVAGSMASEQ